MDNNDGITNPGASTQLQELIAEAYSNSKDHGFHDGEEAMDQAYLQGMKIALMHSELSEALECVRDGEVETTYSGVFTDEDGVCHPGTKPVGLLSEYADVLIRIFDEIGRLGRAEEFEKVLVAKMQYNRSRPHKHGRKC